MLPDGVGRGHALGDPQSSWGEFAITPDGRWLAATGLDHAVYRWDLATNEPNRSSQCIGRGLYTVKGLVCSADSRWLAAWPIIGKSAWLWDFSREIAQQPRVLDAHVGNISTAALGGERPLLATADDRGAIVLWDLGSRDFTHRTLPTRSNEYTVESLRFSSDAQWLAATFIPHADVSKVEHAALVFHLTPELNADGMVLAFPERIQSIDFGPRNSRLYVAGERGSLAAYDLTSAVSPPPPTRLIGHSRRLP